MAYLTSAEFVALAEDANLNLTRLEFLLNVTSAAIDRICRRTFTVVEGDKRFAFFSPNVLRLRHDLAELTEVTTNTDQVFTAADFEFFPVSGPPYRRLQLLGSEPFRVLTTTPLPITVTGIWGYAAEVPAEIKMACYLLTQWEYSAFDQGALASVSSPGLNVAFKSVSREQRIPDEVMRYLTPYMRIRIDTLSGEVL